MLYRLGYKIFISIRFTQRPDFFWEISAVQTAPSTLPAQDVHAALTYCTTSKKKQSRPVDELKGIERGEHVGSWKRTPDNGEEL